MKRLIAFLCISVTVAGCAIASQKETNLKARLELPSNKKSCCQTVSKIGKNTGSFVLAGAKKAANISVAGLKIAVGTCLTGLGCLDLLSTPYEVEDIGRALQFWNGMAEQGFETLDSELSFVTTPLKNKVNQQIAKLYKKQA